MEELAKSVLSFDADEVFSAIRKALGMGINPVEIIEDGLARGLRDVGERFEREELFLTHLVAAGEAVKRGIDELLKPELLRRGTERQTFGKVVLGTVAGDIHDIGKNIVAALIFAAGFDVYDLGKDVPTTKFVEKAREVGADIVGLSALLSTALPVQREVIDALAAAGLRDKMKVIVGGAPATAEWAEKIGADGYAENAIAAVRLVKLLLKIA